MSHVAHWVAWPSHMVYLHARHLCVAAKNHLSRRYPWKAYVMQSPALTGVSCGVGGRVGSEGLGVTMKVGAMMETVCPSSGMTPTWNEFPDLMGKGCSALTRT